MVLAGACGGGERCPPNASCAATAPPGVTLPAGRAVTFRDEGGAQHSGRLSAGIEAIPDGRGLRITVYQGEQPSGGYSIRVEHVTRLGAELRVHAAFITPAPDAIVTQALTSPSHTVIVDESASVVVLYDLTGAERARTAPR